MAGDKLTWFWISCLPERSLAVLCSTHFRKESSLDAVSVRTGSCLTNSGTVAVKHSSSLHTTNRKGYVNFKHGQGREGEGEGRKRFSLLKYFDLGLLVPLTKQDFKLKEVCMLAFFIISSFCPSSLQSTNQAWPWLGVVWIGILSWKQTSLTCAFSWDCQNKEENTQKHWLFLFLYYVHVYILSPSFTLNLNKSSIRKAKQMFLIVSKLWSVGVYINVEYLHITQKKKKDYLTDTEYFRSCLMGAVYFTLKTAIYILWWDRSGRILIDILINLLSLRCC